MDASRIPALLAEHGINATVSSSFGTETLPQGLLAWSATATARNRSSDQLWRADVHLVGRDPRDSVVVVDLVPGPAIGATLDPCHVGLPAPAEPELRVRADPHCAHPRETLTGRRGLTAVPASSWRRDRPEGCECRRISPNIYGPSRKGDSELRGDGVDSRPVDVTTPADHTGRDR